MTQHRLTIEYLNAEGELVKREHLSGSQFTLQVQEGSLQLTQKTTSEANPEGTTATPSETQSLGFLQKLWQRLPAWAWALLLALVYSLVNTAQLWVKHNPDESQSNYVALAAGFAAALIAWAAFWALLGKVFGKTTHFWLHVCWALLCSLLMSLALELMHFLSYSLSWYSLGRIDSLTWATAAGLLIWGHLKWIVPHAHRLTLSLGIGVLTALGLALMMWNNHRKQDSLLDTLHSPHVYAPQLHLGPISSIDSFFEQAKPLQSTLKNKASITEPGEDNVGNYDD